MITDFIEDSLRKKLAEKYAAEKIERMSFAEFENENYTDIVRDKFLLSKERECFDYVQYSDFEMPVTKKFRSSIEEYYISDVGYSGWADEIMFKYLAKISGTDEYDYYNQKVTLLNVSCIDNNGRPCRIDITKDIYQELQEKTSDIRYKDEFRAALENYYTFKMPKQSVNERPYFSYCFGQDDSFDICTVTDCGEITLVKTGMTARECCNELLSIHSDYLESGGCELVTPDRIREVSEERKAAASQGQELSQTSGLHI